MYPINWPTATMEEIKEAMEKGKLHVTRDDKIELTTYAYNNRIYITEIKEIVK